MYGTRVLTSVYWRVLRVGEEFFWFLDRDHDDRKKWKGPFTTAGMAFQDAYDTIKPIEGG